MLKDINVGRYYPASSPLHRADARTKIIVSVLFAIMVFAFDTPAAMLLLGIFCIAGIAIAHIPFGYALKGLKPLRWFILFTIIVNLLFTDGATLWQWQLLRITDRGMLNAVITAYRLVLFVTGTSVLTLTTPPIALTDGIARLMRPLRRIGVPTDDIAMMISVTLRFIPDFADDAEKIMKAQRARGGSLSEKGLIGRIRAVIPVTVPLFASAIRRSGDLALAMDSRCYGKGTRRPRNKSVFSKIDATVFAVTGALAIFLLIFQIMH
ncbi:MAG: energy-coupling factor transporter transmembrane protein EcfT [Clostridia bacterium]|nr:energy-coupling factor transporter transmembrane protein EcfT [Clostridia bacterium]